MNRNVLLTCGWCRTAYVALKSLAARGLDIYVTDFSQTAMCRFSGFKKKFIRIPPANVNNEDEYVNFIISIIEKYSIDVFIPVNEDIFVISKHRDRFPRRVKIPIEKYDTLLKVHNKRCSIEHAIKNKIPVPQTYVVNELAEVEKIADKIHFPAVIKRLQLQGAEGIYYAKNKDELLNIYRWVIKVKNLTPEYYPLIQEYVKGDGYGVSCLFDKGKLKAIFTHKRILEKIPSGGTSTRRISVKNETLENYAIKYLSTLDWHGIAMLEFKYDEKTERGYFLEANPRLWGSINLPFISGVDFPYFLYKVAVGEVFEPVMDYKIGIQSNWILGDMLALINYMSRGKEKFYFLRRFINFKAHGYDDFNKKDILPFFGEFLDYFIKFIIAANRHVESQKVYNTIIAMRTFYINADEYDLR